MLRAGAACAGQGWGHPVCPGHIFCTFTQSEKPGDWSLWEPRLSRAGSPYPGEGRSSGTDPTLFQVSRAKAFPRRLWRWGSVPALPGDRGCQAGCSPAPEQPVGHGEPHWGQGREHGFTVPPSALAAEVKRNYFSHLCCLLAEQILPQLPPSCQSDLAALAEG